MTYRLSYFPFRGRAEQIRLMLHALQQPFEEVPVNRQMFMDMKKQGPKTLPFGSLPVLEDGELRLAQGPVIVGYLARKHDRCPADVGLAARADAIALGAEDLRTKYFSVQRKEADEHKEFLDGDFSKRWLPSFEGLLEESGTGFFAGDGWTHADIAVWDALDAVATYLTDAGVRFSGYERVKALRDRIAELPGLADYLSTRTAK